MLRWYFLILALTFVAQAAATEEEIVVNGGFETGQLQPWTTDEFIMSSGAGGHSGNYDVYMASWGDPPSIDGYIRQDLGRTYYAYEVKSASFWIYPDFLARYGGRYPCQTDFRIYLGDNNEYDVPPLPDTGWGWIIQWYKINVPLSEIQYPFDYVYIWVHVHMTTGTPPYNLYAALDDVSVTISHTGVTPASWGRVKATFR